MPRKQIKLPYSIDYLSILDEDAKLDKKLEPDLSGEFLLNLYRYMLLGRRFDERMLRLQRHLPSHRGPGGLPTGCHRRSA